MKDYIINYCQQQLKRFSSMSDIEIYNWMCDNFCTKDYSMVRQCSMQIYYQSRNIK